MAPPVEEGCVLNDLFSSVALEISDWISAAAVIVLLFESPLACSLLSIIDVLTLLTSTKENDDQLWHCWDSNPQPSSSTI